jgi:hypothetical protein
LTEFGGTPALEDHVIGWVGTSGTEGFVVWGRPGDSASYYSWAGTYEDGLLSSGAYYVYPYDYYGYAYQYSFSLTVE